MLVQDTLPPQEARCAVHAERTSQGTCSRCGNYVCELCTETGRHTACDACRARFGTPFMFTRKAWSVRALSQHSWLAFKREWSTLLPGMLLLLMLSLLVGGAQAGIQLALFGAEASQTPYALKPLLLGSGVGLVLSLLLTPLFIGYLELNLIALRGEPMRFSRLFAAYARFKPVSQLVLVVWLVSVVQNLTMSALYGDRPLKELYPALALVSFATLPIWLYVGVGFGFSYIILADDPSASAKQALLRSWRIVDGHRFDIIGVTVYSLAVVGVSALACLVPLLVSFPWASLVWAGCYLALATPGVTPSSES